jgi:Flp pilus assembly pilin Flp
VIAGLMALAIVTAIGMLGGEVSGMWGFIESRISPALAGNG